MKMFRIEGENTELFVIAPTEAEALRVYADEDDEDDDGVKIVEELPSDSTFSVTFEPDDLMRPGLNYPLGATVEPVTNFDGETTAWWIEAIVADWCELHAQVVARSEV